MDRRRGPADGASMPNDRPPKGSLAELRLRLERLPAGHPSSPYDETGARRPAPQQLRQLELPLADEDEHPTLSRLLKPSADDRSGATAGRAASPGQVGVASFGRASSPAAASAGEPGAGGQGRSEASQSRLSRAAHGEDSISAGEPGSSGAGLSEVGLSQVGLSEVGLSEVGLSDPGLDEPALDDPALDDPGPGDPGLDEPDQYESVRYGNGHYGNGRPDADEPGRYEHSPSRNGLNGNGRNGRGADRDNQDELSENGSAAPAAYARPAAGTGRNGSRRPADFAASDPLPPVAVASALPSRTGSGAHDELAASGLMPRVDDSDPLAPANGFRRHDRADASGVMPRIAADPLPPRNASGRSGTRPGSGPPRGTPGGPSRNSAGRDDTFGSDWAGSSASGGHIPGARLPAERLAGDRLAGERYDGLTPEQEAIADQALMRYKAADGRNVFGGYGESGLTPAMRRVEAHLPHGRLTPDSEQYSLKSPERYKAKLARMIARHPGIPAADLAAEIYDAARYTFVFDPPDYTDGTWLVHRRLKAQGFDLEARRNRWDTPEFKGIRTRWRDPAHDVAFEVQFHTPASWDLVQRTHEAYLRITDPRTPPAERAELREQQVAAAAGTRPPARCAEIGDFRADIR